MAKKPINFQDIKKNHMQKLQKDINIIKISNKS